VKRIRPDALGPFDYTQENYTKVLWVAEGITDYYADLVLRRAGLISESEYLTAIARSIQNMQNTPGRLEQSVEESSFDAWVKYYRQDENSVNSQVSYYDKGALLGLLLDLEIRKRSGGAKSLDDVMRYLYAEFYKKNRNYGPADFQKACELMAGGSFEEFFSKYVRGKEELDYNAALEAAGLRLETSAAADAKVYFGADVVQEDDRLMVRRVYAGSPAYEHGLNAGDEIVAFDNMRATRDFFNARMAEKKPGDLVNLTIFRFDNLSLLPIRLGDKREMSYRILPVAAPTTLQKQIHADWLK
jgi:predicted metalloprotease with PDZ domain